MADCANFKRCSRRQRCLRKTNNDTSRPDADRIHADADIGAVMRRRRPRPKHVDGVDADDGGGDADACGDVDGPAGRPCTTSCACDAGVDEGCSGWEEEKPRRFHPRSNGRGRPRVVSVVVSRRNMILTNSWNVG